MNTQLAYWIRICNMSHVYRYSFGEMGVISPARGVGYGSDTWTIVRLNRALKRSNPSLWSNLPNHPDAPHAMRTALQRSAP